MKNILLILKHEYITRVSKKSFIIMTLIGPLLIALFYGAIIGITYFQLNSSDSKSVAIYDPYLSLGNELPKLKNFDFQFTNNPDTALSQLENKELNMILSILSKQGDSCELIAKKTISITEKEQIKSMLSDRIFNQNLKSKGLTSEMIDSMKHNIVMNDKLTSGESNASEVKSAIGYAGAFVIYMFIFLYGVMIMKSVTEEKNNRIVEIIISAVKPFELMMGKIWGVALVGLTQFVSWILLSGLLLVILSVVIGISSGGMDASGVQEGIETAKSMKINNASAEIFNQLNAINFPKILFGFAMFFLGGFLLYSSLFAAIGSAVDNETETQQFVLPISMPLIFAFIIAQVAVLKDPNSSLAVWCSMIPLTSPVVMMVRLPFDVSWFELLSSILILFTTFVLMVWLSSKIYRIGILSYGQKASYKQIFKWLRTK
jgi:ABC-2 type transport system permease protein